MRWWWLLVSMVLVAVLGVAGCSEGSAGQADGTAPGQRLTVHSMAWPDGGALHPPYACTHRGDRGTSPSLSWSAGPEGTKFYAITILDTDADDFVHWAALNLPATTTSLPKGSSGQAHELTNSFGYPGYGAPCPPRAETHHYALTVWALSHRVAGIDKLADTALASGTLTATYRR